MDRATLYRKVLTDCAPSWRMLRRGTAPEELATWHGPYLWRHEIALTIAGLRTRARDDHPRRIAGFIADVRAAGCREPALRMARLRLAVEIGALRTTQREIAILESRLATAPVWAAPSRTATGRRARNK